MKLDQLFKSESNKLFLLDDTEVKLMNITCIKAAECDDTGKNICDKETVYLVEVPHSLNGSEASGYNEEFLAALRDWLKILDDKKQFAIIKPVEDNILKKEEQSTFIADMKHCARRIKDCVSVIGFVIPDNTNTQLFKTELSEKHKHYIYFSGNDDILQDKSIVKISC